MKEELEAAGDDARHLRHWPAWSSTDRAEITARVATCAELAPALEQAAKSWTGVSIEVVADALGASPLSLRLHDAMQAHYKA